MPRPVRDVAGHVGVEGRVLHGVADVIRVPRTVRPLPGAEPLVCALGLGVPSADVEGHGRLDEVPRIGVVAGSPRDVAVGQLDRGDGVDRGREIVGGHDSIDVAEHVHSGFSV